MERVRGRATEIIKGLEQLSWVESLRDGTVPIWYPLISSVGINTKWKGMQKRETDSSL